MNKYWEILYIILLNIKVTLQNFVFVNMGVSYLPRPMQGNQQTDASS